MHIRSQHKSESQKSQLSTKEVGGQIVRPQQRRLGMLGIPSRVHNICDAPSHE